MTTHPALARRTVAEEPATPCWFHRDLPWAEVVVDTRTTWAVKDRDRTMAPLPATPTPQNLVTAATIPGWTITVHQPAPRADDHESRSAIAVLRASDGWTGAVVMADERGPGSFPPLLALLPLVGAVLDPGSSQAVHHLAEKPVPLPTAAARSLVAFRETATAGPGAVALATDPREPSRLVRALLEEEPSVWFLLCSSLRVTQPQAVAAIRLMGGAGNLPWRLAYPIAAWQVWGFEIEDILGWLASGVRRPSLAARLAPEWTGREVEEWSKTPVSVVTLPRAAAGLRAQGWTPLGLQWAYDAWRIGATMSYAEYLDQWLGACGTAAQACLMLGAGLSKDEAARQVMAGTVDREALSLLASLRPAPSVAVQGATPRAFLGFPHEATLDSMDASA